MSQNAVLALPRPIHHAPRREGTATSVLRAIGTGPVPVVGFPGGSTRTATTADRPRVGDLEGRDATASRGASGPGVGALRLRDIAAGGAAAAGSWSLAAHLGVLGTATGTFIASVVSAVLLAIAADSLTGVRRLLLRAVRALRGSRRHRSRAATRGR